MPFKISLSCPSNNLKDKNRIAYLEKETITLFISVICSERAEI